MNERVNEALRYLRDVSGYFRFATRAGLSRLPGFGNDYTEARFQKAAVNLVSKIHPTKMRLQVTEVIEETATAKTLRFRRVDGPVPPFRAGQYTNVFVTIDGVKTSRPYSMSSPPGHKHLDLTVKEVTDGFVSPYLVNEVKVGDVIETSGPAGGFYFEPLIHGRRLVFLAGGSGITPFMSIIRDAISRPDELDLDIHLLYGSRAPDDIIFGDELRRIADESERIRVDFVMSEPPAGYKGLKGFLDSDLIGERVDELGDKRFFICGPGVMYKHCEAALDKLGVPSFKVKRELYGPPAEVTDEPGWPDDVDAESTFQVEIEGLETIPAKAGEPLLNSLERHGKVVPVLCRAGECSTCRLRLLEGEVFMPADVGLRESDRAGGYIHSCVAYPVSDLKLRT